jgi:hypothetical protein
MEGVGRWRWGEGPDTQKEVVVARAQNDFLDFAIIAWEEGEERRSVDGKKGKGMSAAVPVCLVIRN